MDHHSYTTEEVAKRLKVSKLTVYDLIKKGELPSYRVGRQMRIDAADLDQYIKQMKTGKVQVNPVKNDGSSILNTCIIISGQELTLDMLAKRIENRLPSSNVLRAYQGSLTSLVKMYQGEGSIVSLHLFDGETGTYNIPYVKRILVGQPCLMINLLSRNVGFYVQKGNPKKIKTWADISGSTIKFVNREKGSGIRVLVDEQLRIRKLNKADISGYEWEESNHLGVATQVANGKADVGVGSEKFSQIVNVDFIPIMKEQYDLVILKNKENEELIEVVKDILQSEEFHNELNAIGGYDITKTGQIVYEIK
ncbi:MULTISPECIES: substrate-binding domain-containing protein [Bacillus cereus group]|uniref:substrate-binding domain-containing protein n=1 Tax=Bacillus cereus group TaxID=86661 RepID=UPI001155771D|nr:MULTISPECIES: substrate-binding domain-containing protein [Bacillus cereus group]MCU5354714.1 excisionase family DNA-binding protein [Bacillus cereus]MDA2549787.1 excisionase family DNA-binding protein [Bacillus cereus]MDA2555195.1 excisionase family DNA-binding protein [Bacillus cereus]MDA2650259.1 excisionase family DNA-binding protein [Bacillus cereus]MDZ4543416.1 excisionase family DNA-binding protein [Bacillus cereus]